MKNADKIDGTGFLPLVDLQKDCTSPILDSFGELGKEGFALGIGGI